MSLGVSKTVEYPFMAAAVPLIRRLADLFHITGMASPYHLLKT